MEDVEPGNGDNAVGCVMDPAVLLISVSSTMLKKDDNTIARQRAVGRQQADKLGLRITHEIIETSALGATSESYMIFKSLRNHFNNHPEVRNVIFPSMGRASRTLEGMRELINEFESGGICIAFSDGRIALSKTVAAVPKVLFHCPDLVGDIPIIKGAK